MDISDILTVDLDDDMIRTAEAEQVWLDEHKQGAKTRNAYNDKDIVGSLAHQAVEVSFANYNVPFTSTRLERYDRGDTCDIVYEDDTLDVKGTHGKIDQWFYNKGFLVFQAQLDDPKTEAITHFVFVLVDRDAYKAHIFGVIRRTEFLDKSTPVTLKYENRRILARQLTPFSKYVYRIR